MNNRKAHKSLLFSHKILHFLRRQKSLNNINFRKCITYLLIGVFINFSSFGQNDTPKADLPEYLKKIDQQISKRDYNNAKLLVEELKKEVTIAKPEDQFAIDLRVAKIKYYGDHDEESIQRLLVNIVEIDKMNILPLQYEYNSFIAQVFKYAKNFEKAILYYKKTLLNAEKRNDTSAVIFSCLKIGSCFYRVEYIDTPEYYKNNVDSALFYYKKALLFPENEKNNKLFSRIYDNLCKIEIVNGDINIAEAYASKALKINEDSNNTFGVAVSLTNLSNIYSRKGEYKKAIESAQKSIFFIKNQSLRLKKDNLEYIAKNYEKLKDYDSAYYYLDKAYVLSQRIAKYNLAKDIDRIEAKYNIYREQQETLKEKNKRLKTQLLLYSTLFLSIILLISGISLHKRNKRYKRRFEELMYYSAFAKEASEELIKPDDKNTSDLSPEMVESILKGLDAFEKKQEFLTKNITLKDVAKKMETNSSYLSKVVNSYKKKNFATYLNELRIHYIVDELKNNKQLRTYTIEAIADYVGYNNAQSFSLAFRKITGLYPSYFIKQLERK